MRIGSPFGLIGTIHIPPHLCGHVIHVRLSPGMQHEHNQQAVIERLCWACLGGIEVAQFSQHGLR
jgi:hypothetical protein